MYKRQTIIIKIINIIILNVEVIKQGVRSILLCGSEEHVYCLKSLNEDYILLKDLCVVKRVKPEE